MNSLEQSPTLDKDEKSNNQFENSNIEDSKKLLDNDGQETKGDNDPNIVEANQKISLSLEGKAPNFNLKEAKVKEKIKKPISFLNNKSVKKTKKANLAKIDKLVLREIKDDYLKISVLLNDSKRDDLKESKELEDKSLKLNDDIKKVDDLSNLIDEKKKDLANIKVKKRNKFLRKLFGRGKQERDYIEKQQEIQREELRNKLNQVFANDKKAEEKEKEKGKISKNVYENFNEVSSVKTDDFKSSLNDLYTQEEVLDSFIDNKKKQLVFAFKDDIENLENSWGEYSLVLGKNILPSKQKRRKAKLHDEPKEELSEIDKLYLSAFSDVSIPDDDIDLDDDEFFINDPLEVEELYNLADESLSNDMESAILFQLNSLKQDIDALEDSNNNLNNADTSKIRKEAFSNPIREVREKKNFNNKKDLKLRITNKVIKRSAFNKPKSNENNVSRISENFFVRCSGFIIDSLFVISVCLFFSLYNIVSKSGSFSQVYNDPIYLIGFLSLFMKSLILGFLIYYILFYTFFQTSFGLAILSYKLKSIDNSRPRIRQILVRVLCMPLNLLSISGLFGNQSLQGKISKTMLVKEV